MGIIEKQATKNAFYSYLGAGLGFITLICLAHVLTTDENGLIRILISISALFAQFSNMGFASVTTRVFPYFRNKDKGHHGFLFYAIIIALGGFVLCFLVFQLFKGRIIESNIQKSKLFVDYLFYVMPLTLFTLFFNVFDAYLRSGFNSVIGIVTKEFWQRVLILGLLVLFLFKLIDFSIFIFFYVVATSLPTLILLYVIIRHGEWHVKTVKGFVTKEMRDNIIRLSLYSIFAGFSSAIIVNIDNIMVNQMLGLSKTGVYSIAFYFGSMIIIPSRSIYRIAASIVAEAFKENNLDEIALLYRKTCNTQLTLGLILFIGIWANIDNIFRILPAEYALGRNVILFISAGYLVEMATGINQYIVSTSKYYRYQAYFICVSVVTIIISNYLLIPIYGITGSAIATTITITVGNALHFLLLKIKYKMQPYDVNTIKLIAIAVISFLPGYLIPKMNNVFIDIAIRSSVVAGLFILLILKLEAAPDLNQKVRKNLKRLSIHL